ncbi:MAG: serine hydrolase [Chloroflexia bacterium]|nr:serine hydrolase [Chloroflexia bacterium]
MPPPRSSVGRSGWGRCPARLRSLLVLFVIVFTALAPIGQAHAAPVSWAALDRSLGAIAPKSNLLIAEFAGSGCEPIHGRDEDQRLAIASVFKLYVLAELARQVQRGTVSWTDRVALRDDLRSMPMGDYAFEPAGTRVPVRTLAEAMIWRSDNTATDHLIHLLGRANVYGALAAFGHTDSSINSPLLLTRELFAIKMTQSPEWMRRYMSASDSEQMAMLKTDIDPLRLNPGGGWGNWNGPTAIDGIEWFASATELCRASASLWSLGAQRGLEPVRGILTGNRDMVQDRKAWKRAGYKAGLESGVVNMTYILQRSDGRIFFVSAGYNATRGTIDRVTAKAALVPVFACLGARLGNTSCTNQLEG